MMIYEYQRFNLRRISEARRKQAESAGAVELMNLSEEYFLQIVLDELGLAGWDLITLECMTIGKRKPPDGNGTEAMDRLSQFSMAITKSRETVSADTQN